MGSRKTDAINIAIDCVLSTPTDSYEGERAKTDIVSVLEEAARYFLEQEKPRTPTIADNYPAGYREPLCLECCIRDEIKDELVGRNSFSVKAKAKLERTLRDHEERREIVRADKYMGQKKRENYLDWLGQEIREIKDILKEAP